MPTAAFRKGDFSAARRRRSTTRRRATPPATAGTQFANNQIPANRISPIALDLLAKIPLPNLAGVALGQANYQVNSYRDKNTDSFDTKLNYAVNESNQISVRFSYQRPEVTQLPADGLRRLGRPARRRLHGHRHEHDVQHGGELDAHVLEHVPHGSPRRHELLPQRGR